MARQLKAPWFGTWTIKTADAAYALLRLEARGNKQASGQLDSIRKAAPKDWRAAHALKMFNLVAKLVLRGLPAPSVVQQRLAARKQKAQQQLQMALQKRQALTAQRRVATQRIKARGARAEAVLQRMRAQQSMLMQQLAAARQDLVRRDITDDVREQTAEQAAALEGKIATLEERGIAATPEDEGQIDPGNVEAMPPEAEGAVADMEFNAATEE